MIQLEETDSISPVCPHCKAEIRKIYCQELTTVLGKRHVYFCTECKSVLGISNRKGFWMG